MNQNEMIQSLRAEIAKLQRVLDLLLDQPSAPEEVRRVGRPKGSGNRATSFNPEESAPKKRTMSAEGKARIAAAQKKRWAAQNDSDAGGTTRKKAASAKRTGNAVGPKAVSKVAPAAAKKSTAAGKRSRSIQAKAQTASPKRSPTVAARENGAKRGLAKKTNRAATKSSAKQAAPAGPEIQTTT